MGAMPWPPLLLLLLAGACALAPDQPMVTPGTVAVDDGTMIAYDVCGGGKTALVLVHGWACDRSFWQAQQRAFAADYTVITLDLAGHGESATTRTDFSAARLGRDVAEVVRRLDLESVVLVGHSLGGPACLAAAGELHGRVRAVIGIDCLHDVELQLTAKMVDGMVAGFEQDCAGSLRNAVQSAFPAGSDPALVQWVTERALRTNPATVTGVLQGYVGLDQAALLRRAKVPVRCIEAAPYQPGGPVVQVAQNRKHGDFDAVVIAATGHFVMLQRPDAVNAQLRQWIEQFAGVR
jgi:pimeloyl-ACP methyl ester carboxylesterase